MAPKTGNPNLELMINLKLYKKETNAMKLSETTNLTSNSNDETRTIWQIIGLIINIHQLCSSIYAYNVTNWKPECVKYTLIKLHMACVQLKYNIGVPFRTA